MTLFLYHAGRTFPVLERWIQRVGFRPATRTLARLSSYLEARRNPRDFDYMRELAKQRAPHFAAGLLVALHDDDLGALHVEWSSIDEITLLWPDGNGTGWARIEREVFRKRRPAARVVVLNGRGRSFVLTRSEWTRARWRRGLEKTLPVEFLVLGAFVLSAPVLALWDLLHGRIEQFSRTETSR